MERADIPFTNEHFAAWCLAMVGQPYWYGATAERCTEELLRAKAKQYPAQYTPERMPQFLRDIAAKAVCADCVGACKGYAWSGGGAGPLAAIGTGRPFAVRYRSNGCPDTTAEGMFDYARRAGMAWGDMDSFPDVAGLALRHKGHIGYALGDGTAVEWRGFDTGCSRTRIAARAWTQWYRLPFIQYELPQKSADF